MKIDSLQMLEGSVAENLTVNSGTSFPNLPMPGELFFRTDISGGRLYVYSNTEWILIGTGDGGGGEVTLASLNLENVNNTADIDKPISTATQAALDLKANIADLASSELLYNVKTVEGDYSIIQEDVDLNTFIRVVSPLNVTAFVTLPTDTEVVCPIGTTVVISLSGYGPVTLVASPGATVSSPQSLTIDRRFGRVLAIKTANNHWEVDGQLVAQVQFFVVPINPHFTYADWFVPSFVPVDVNDTITADLYVWENQIIADVEDSDRSLAVETQIPANVISNDSNYFANNFPVGKYFKANVISGTATLLEITPDENSWTYGCLAENVYGVYQIPVSADNYAANLTNPRWRFESSLADFNPITYEITVSNTDTDDEIIGTFTTTIQTPLFGNLISNFANDIPVTLAGTSGGIKIHADGRILNANGIGTVASYATWLNGTGFYNGLYFTVTEVGNSGFYNTNVGSSGIPAGELGTTYTMQGATGVVFGPVPEATGPMTLQIDISHDLNGGLEWVTSGTFVFN